MSKRKPANVTCLPNDLIESKVFLELSGKSLQVYIFFLKRRKMAKKGSEWRCENGRGLTLTYSDAKRMGIPTETFRRCIHMLHGVGLLDIVRHGGGTEKRETVYGLSERWRFYGTDGFDPGKFERHSRGFCKPR